MTDQSVPYTSEDRKMLREMHDALVGTIERKGLLHVVEDHVGRNHDDAHEVAVSTAEEVVKAHEISIPHVVDRRTSMLERAAFKIGTTVGSGLLMLLIIWAFGVFALGLQVSFGATPSDPPGVIAP